MGMVRALLGCGAIYTQLHLAGMLEERELFDASNCSTTSVIGKEILFDD